MICNHENTEIRTRVREFPYGEYELCYIKKWTKCMQCNEVCISPEQARDAIQSRKDAIEKFEAGLRKYRKTVFELDI